MFCKDSNVEKMSKVKVKEGKFIDKLRDKDRTSHRNSARKAKESQRYA